MSQSRIIYFLLIIIVALIVCTLFFANGMFKYYKAYLERGLYPYGNIKQTVMQMDSLQQNILMVGDSRSKHWDVSGDTWSGFKVHKIAQSGFTTAQIKTLSDNAKIKGSADWAVLCMGINDLKASYFLPHQREAIGAAVVGNFEQIARQLEAHQAQIIVCNVFPEGRHGGIRRLVWPSEMQTLIESVNADLQLLCDKKGYLYLDAYSLMMNGKAKAPAEALFYKDFLHLNPKGYAVLNNHLMKLINGEA